MKRPIILLELVGEQPTPNLIPALEYRPDEVVFLVSDRTAPHARGIQAALERVPELAGTGSTLVRVDPYSIAAAERAVEDVLARDRDGHLIFNLTGGTKPMMLGMYRVASARRWRGRATMVYVSTERETEQTIVDDRFQERALALQIPALVYLRAHGVTADPLSPPPPASWVEAAIELARQVEADTREQRRKRTVTRMLARICKEAHGKKDNELRRHCISLPRKSVRVVLLGLLRRCQAAGILGDLTVTGGKVTFKLNGSRAFFFLKGGWLEIYVAQAARRTEAFHDVLVHTPISHPRWKRRELDVVAMRGFVAVVCSCKAARTPSGSRRNLPLDELDACSRALGRYCGKVFVSSRRGYTDAFVDKAAGMGIHVVRPQELTAVGDVLVQASHSKGHPLTGAFAELSP